MKIVVVDHPQSDLSLEENLVRKAGMSFGVAEPQCRTSDDVIRAAADADALIVQYAPITEEVFAALPRLYIVSLPLIGVDAVDIEAARRHGVWVANVPDACFRETAVHALAMALGLIRHLPFFDRMVRAGGWGYEATGHLWRPGELTLGIVGLGRIGRYVAACAAPVFGKILGYDPMVDAQRWPDGVERIGDLSSMFRRSDVLTFHVPLTRETRHLVGRELLAEARPGAYLVNVSRGPVVDPHALLDALDSGHLAGAALDVFEQEPPDADDRLRSHPKVMVSPHAAFYSVQSEDEARARAIMNIIDFARSGRPNDFVVAGTKIWNS
jgi:D-3-phosphoglycerate dehydrogenase